MYRHKLLRVDFVDVFFLICLNRDTLSIIIALKSFGDLFFVLLVFVIYVDGYDLDSNNGAVRRDELLLVFVPIIFVFILTQRRKMIRLVCQLRGNYI